MNKLILPVIAVPVFAALSTCSCLAASAENSNSIQEVSQQEVTETTGIELLPFDEAENVTFCVIGEKTAAMNFNYNDKEFCYRAEFTDEFDAYDMSGLSYEWNEEGETQIGYCDAFFRACEEASVIYWIDLAPGINYTLSCNEYTEFDEMIEVGQNCFHSAQDEDWNMDGTDWDNTDWADEDGWTVSEYSPADLISIYTWKYDGSDTYFRNYDNKTYAFYDENMNSDGKIHFWEASESDDSISLLDDNGNECLTMTITEAYEGAYDDQPFLTDSESKTLSPIETAMNGTYHCQMNSSFLQDDHLYLATELPFYVSNIVVKTLKPGDHLNNTNFEYMGVDVESIEKKSDTLYLINDMYNLSYQSEQDAWLLEDDAPMYAQVGYSQITADTQITNLDGTEISDFASFLDEHDFAEADVTTETGNITQISITSLE